MLNHLLSILYDFSRPTKDICCLKCMHKKQGRLGDQRRILCHLCVYPHLRKSQQPLMLDVARDQAVIPCIILEAVLESCSPYFNTLLYGLGSFGDATSILLQQGQWPSSLHRGQTSSPVTSKNACAFDMHAQTSWLGHRVKKKNDGHGTERCLFAHTKSVNQRKLLPLVWLHCKLEFSGLFSTLKNDLLL